MQSVSHQVSEASLDLVAHHGATHGPTYHEANQWVFFPTNVEMHHQSGPADSLSAFDSGGEVLPASHAELSR